jgi:hypothetical protein
LHFLAVLLLIARAALKCKHLAKQTFGAPSLVTAEAIDNSDKVSALHAAGYRYDARVREIELQFEAKIAELREAYLDEVADIHGSEKAA